MHPALHARAPGVSDHDPPDAETRAAELRDDGGDAPEGSGGTGEQSRVRRSTSPG